MGNETEQDADTRTEAGKLLARAALLIETPQTWTKRALARDKHSHPVSPTSERAVRFCVSGALIRAAADHLGITVRIAMGDEPITFVRPDSLLLAYELLGQTMGEVVFKPGVVTLLSCSRSMR